jgi:hypothetical protein
VRAALGVSELAASYGIFVERARSSLVGINAPSAARCLGLVREMLPELDAVAFRVEEADELALPLGVWSDGHGRGLHAVVVQASDDCVDVVDPVVDDVTLARLGRIARHNREHDVLVLVWAIELPVVQLDVVRILVGEVPQLSAQVALIPLRERPWIARKEEHSADH